MRICSLKKRNSVPDVLLLLEHPPTVTLGRNASRRNLLVSTDELRVRGIRCFEVDRGGDVTFHGPGQLIGYPILKLDGRERDVHLYMRRLEESLIGLLARFGIESGREAGFTGVWTARGKIAALGVHISRWVTRHGFALNVNTDLSFFDCIIPCGIRGKGVVSMAGFLERPVTVQEAAGQYAQEFGRVFDRDPAWVSASDLMQELEHYARENASA